MAVTTREYIGMVIQEIGKHEDMYVHDKTSQPLWMGLREGINLRKRGAAQYQTASFRTPGYWPHGDNLIFGIEAKWGFDDWVPTFQSVCGCMIYLTLSQMFEEPKSQKWCWDNPWEVDRRFEARYDLEREILVSCFERNRRKHHAEINIPEFEGMALGPGIARVINYILSERQLDNWGGAR